MQYLLSEIQDQFRSLIRTLGVLHSEQFIHPIACDTLQHGMTKFAHIEFEPWTSGSTVCRSTIYLCYLITYVIAC